MSHFKELSKAFFHIKLSIMQGFDYRVVNKGEINIMNGQEWDSCIFTRYEFFYFLDGRFVFSRDNVNQEL